MKRTRKKTNRRRTNKKKAHWKKASYKVSLRDIIAVTYFIVCVGLLAYCFIATPILLHILKKHGNKTEAVITSTTIGGPRYTKPNYIYEFYVGDKTYEGNSLVDERDSSKIGTKIQILYLDWLPWFNRPVYYWDDAR